MNLTKDYYKNNAEQFAKETVDADIGDVRERFLKHIPEGGTILDFGCGSGRDTKAFKDAGYDVHAIDGSEELCRMASEYSGVEVKCMDFFSFDEVDKYNGIFACASLLHIPPERLPELITKMLKSLKKGGVIYMSFKYGDFSGERDGRHFTDLDEERFRKILSLVKGARILEEWHSEDVRRGKTASWLNEIIVV